MAAEQLLLDFVVILIVAEIGGALFRRIRLPRAVGMLVAGILLGPFTPGYVVRSSVVDLAVLGAVFLMFTRGPSFDIRNFRKLGAWPFLHVGYRRGRSSTGSDLVRSLGRPESMGRVPFPPLSAGLGVRERTLSQHLH